MHAQGLQSMGIANLRVAPLAQQPVATYGRGRGMDAGPVDGHSSGVAAVAPAVYIACALQSGSTTVQHM